MPTLLSLGEGRVEWGSNRHRCPSDGLKYGKLRRMRLYLIQHGDALPKEDDPDRPLSESGRQDVQRLAEFVAARGVRFSSALHSGKTRAMQTAGILGSIAAPEIPVTKIDGFEPNDPVEPAADQFLNLAGGVLVVGHQPFLGKLVARLITGNETTETVAFRPGTMVCLEQTGDGAWAIAWMLRPELVS